jgi:choline/glycine/proline betaine transport protein
VTLFVVGSVSSIDSASATLIGTKEWVIQHFDWLFVLVATVSVVAVAILAIHPRANVRLGPEDSRPEFGNLSWFAMLFSAGLASGLLYWATAEPILHLQENPFWQGAADGEGAVVTALRLTVLHWGVHGWSFYVLAALAIAIYSYRHGHSLSFRSALTPVLGPKWVDRWPGLAVDLLALFGTVCGVATSIGLSAASLNATLGGLIDLEVELSNQIAIVFGVCVLGVLSALSGLAKGIRRLSELNVWVSGALLAVFIALGPTLFLGGLFVEVGIDYVLGLIPDGMWLAETPADQAWQASWTVFYWGWWLAWTPFVSLFIARISRGRTVREFAIAVMLVPTLVTILWMTVLGGTALHQELLNPGSVSVAVNQDYSRGIVAVIENLGWPAAETLLTVTATFLLFSWLITSLDSATLVICHLLGSEESAAAKVFWGLALASVTTVLLLVGGLEALQAASIIVGLPLAVLMLALTGGLLRDFLFRKL